MQAYYQKWLDEQINWFNEQEKEFKKIRNRAIMSVIIGCMVALFVLGLFVGDFKVALQNAFFGLVLGLMIALISVLGTKSPRKCYLKSLKKEMSREFPEDFDQDCFARKMLEAAGNNATKKIVWERSGGRTGKIEITNEYAIIFWENRVTVVKLGQIELMELDEQILNISVRNEYATVRRRQEDYPIRFFYRDTEAAGSDKKKQVDKQFYLPTRDLRDQIARAIEATQEG